MPECHSQGRTGRLRRSTCNCCWPTSGQAIAEGEPIYIPSICLLELTYLIEKIRVPEVARERLLKALDDPGTHWRLVPLNRMVADVLEFVSRRKVPDMPDRVICATALALRVPLISRDGKIRASQIQTIW